MTGETVAYAEGDSQDPEFVRGRDLGRLEAALEVLDSVPFSKMVLISNTEMVARFAHAHGREYSAEPVDDDWMIVRFEAPSLPNIHDAIQHPGP